jgi:hypothetical protein
VTSIVWPVLDLVFRALTGQVMVASLLASSYWLAWWLLGPRPFALRWVATVGLGMWISTIGFHLLRAGGCFTLTAALPASMGLAAVVIGGLSRRVPSIRVMVAADRRALGRLARSYWRQPWRQPALVFTPFVAAIVGHTLIAPPLAWDTLTYHGPRAVLWVQTGQATFDPAPGSWSIYRYHFAGAEVFLAWPMLVFRSDVLAGLATAVQWLGIGLAAWALGREVGLRGANAELAALSILFIPSLQLLVGTGYVEPALNCALTSGLALACRFLRSRGIGAGLAACMALGVAGGTKFPALPPVAIAISVMLVAVIARPGRDQRWWFVAVGVPAAAVCVFPWIGVAIAETGAPFSPIPLRVFGMTLGSSNAAMEWYLLRPDLEPYRWMTEFRALLTVIGIPWKPSEALGLITVAALVASPLGFRVVLRERPLAAAMLLVVAGTILTGHFSPGASVVRLGWATHVARFLIPLAIIVIVVSLAWVDRPSGRGHSYRNLLFGMTVLSAALHVAFGWAPHEYADTVVAIAVLVAIVAAAAWLARRSVPVAIVGIVAAVTASVLVLGSWVRVTRYDAARSARQLHPVPWYWVDGARLLDDPSRPRVVAFTAGSRQAADHWFTYLFFGQEFQNRIVYIPVSRDGRIIEFGPRGELEGAADKEAWLERLRTEGVTEIVSLAPPSVEQWWMETQPDRFERLTGIPGVWGVYRVR